MDILIRLLEAKPRDDGKFFTDSKGKVHPLEPSKEAVAYARKMGFKHTVGGKPVDLKMAKVIGKNVLHDMVTGATGGAAGGFAARGWKGAAIGGALGGATGAVWGVGEGVIKHKILNKKTREEQARIISSNKYRIGDIANTAFNAAIPAALIGGILRKGLWKNEFKPLVKEYKILQKAGEVADKAEKLKVLRRKIFAVGFKIKAEQKFVPAVIAGQVGLDASHDAASDAIAGKVYGSDNPGTVAHQTYFYTDKSLGSGMFSPKKYKYGGFGPEVVKKERRREDIRIKPTGKK